MESDISTDPASIKFEMVRVIKDFSQYFLYQKKKQGIHFLIFLKNLKA